MKTDALFYRFAKELPDAFFELIGRPPTDAARYRFDAIELKDTAVRIDGLYVPQPPDETAPVYFVEFQNHRSTHTYSNLLLKIGLYLEKVNPRQNWQAVVVYPHPGVEQENTVPYRGFLGSEQFTRIYLNQLPPPPQGKFGLEIVRMMAASPRNALVAAQSLVPAIRNSKLDLHARRRLIELIETVVLYQFPVLSRRELEKMLQVNDFRETKVYQEALEEGREEGKRLGVAEASEAIARRLLAEGLSAAKIAAITGLTQAQVKKLKKQPTT
jgi:predicted transposase/invertase (TIGR01784 family)